jgi:hypothetical protein
LVAVVVVVDVVVVVGGDGGGSRVGEARASGRRRRNMRMWPGVGPWCRAGGNGSRRGLQRERDANHAGEGLVSLRRKGQFNNACFNICFNILSVGS